MRPKRVEDATKAPGCFATPDLSRMGAHHGRRATPGPWGARARAGGVLAQVTDPLGHAMRYAYAGGVLVREVHKGGLTFHFEWDWEHPEGWCTRTWGDAGDSDGSCMDLAPGGRAPKAIYDRRLTYDKHRRRTMVHDGRGGITYFEGNALELVEKEIDATGRTTKYAWNDHAWKIAEENAAGERFEWSYDVRGNRTRQVDPLGHVTSWTYDDLDRLRSVTTPRGGVFELEYDRASRPSVVRRPDGTANLYSHDELGRLVQADDPMGRRTRFRWTVTHSLAEATDAEGRTTTFAYDVFGRLTSAKDPLGRVLRAIRDAAGQPSFVKRPDGEELSLAYDPEGNVIEQTDSRGRRTRMRYAGMGQLVEHLDPMGHRVRLRYDEELDLVAVENQTGDLYTFQLDRCGRVTHEKTFSGTKRMLTYDKAGRAMQVLSGAYRLTKIERDPLGRIVKQTSQGGNPNVLAKPTEETFAYDEIGALVAAATPGADVRFERDVLGRILREHELVKATSASASIQSRYDAAGLRVERTTSWAHRTDYTWNNAGELTAVAAGWDLGSLVTPLRRALPQASQQPFEIKIARDPLGQELARRLPGGVVSTWDRDPWGRATEQRVLVGASTQSPGRAVARRSYAWASPDEIASITTMDPTSGVPKAQSQYEYDPRGHLIRQLFSSGEVLERQSDPAGNLFKSRDRSDRTYGPGGVIDARTAPTSRSTPTASSPRRPSATAPSGNTSGTPTASSPRSSDPTRRPSPSPMTPSAGAPPRPSTARPPNTCGTETTSSTSASAMPAAPSPPSPPGSSSPAPSPPSPSSKAASATASSATTSAPPPCSPPRPARSPGAPSSTSTASPARKKASPGTTAPTTPGASQASTKTRRLGSTTTASATTTRSWAGT